MRDELISVREFQRSCMHSFVRLWLVVYEIFVCDGSTNEDDSKNDSENGSENDSENDVENDVEDEPGSSCRQI